MIRTIQEYELAGVSAAIHHQEDQVMPKKCGHMENKQVIAAAEMTEKIYAAVEARSSSDFLIIARTDARAVEGLDSALRRARAYREAGADILFVEAPQKQKMKSRRLPGLSRMCHCSSTGPRAERLRQCRWSGSRNLAIASLFFQSARC